MNSKEFYKGLSEDVKAKIKACKSEAEMMGVLDAEKIELDPAVLDEVSGGGPVGNFCPSHTGGTSKKLCDCHLDC